MSQTDGKPLPELGEMAGDPGAYTQRLTTLIASIGITLDYSADLGGATASRRRGRS